MVKYENISPELENELLELAAKGYSDSFGLLVGKYQARLRAYASRYILNHDDVYDLVQDTFLEAYRSLHRFEPGRSFYPWVRAICRHRLLNYMKQQSRNSHRSLEFIDEYFIRQATSDSDTESELQLEALRICINKMKRKYKEMIKLRYYDNVAVNDIARQFNKTATSISMLMGRIRATLSKCVKYQLVQSQHHD